MTDHADIKTGYDKLAGTADRGLIYTCNCGWLDLGHAFHPSTDPLVGAENLWKQVNAGGPDAVLSFWYFYPPRYQRHDYPQSVLNRMKADKIARFPDGATGYRVTVRQAMGRLSLGVTRSFLVRRGLTEEERRRVALSIFLLVSWDFEAFQFGLEWGGVLDFATRVLLDRGYDSGFSREDLVSNLIGFYVAVGAMTRERALELCHPASRDAAEWVWRTEGPVGARKNRGLVPDLADQTTLEGEANPVRDDCTGQPRAFPVEFQSIHPAPLGRTVIELREG